jgi:hypothetical protein
MAKAKKPISLAAFLRKLWSDAELMEEFSRSREGRRAVMKRFRLSARHAALLLEGCVNDLVLELAGVKPTKAMNFTTVINCDRSSADVSCGHPECEKFMATLVKEQKPRKKKKR